jgi:uncharacterized protein DUF6193
MLAKEVDDLYPELIAAGGLVNGVQAALREIGSSLPVSGKSVTVACARVTAGERASQVYLVAQRRLFVFDLWIRDSILAGATTGSLAEGARAIDRWLSSQCSALDVISGLELVAVRDDGTVEQGGDAVEEHWCSYIVSASSHGTPDLVAPAYWAFVREAAQRTKLRQLFPYGGAHFFGFSRCTKYPFTTDTPFVVAVGQGRFAVVTQSGTELGRGNAAYAADMVVSHLPPNCGAAVPGTAAALEPSDYPSRSR